MLQKETFTTYIYHCTSFLKVVLAVTKPQVPEKSTETVNKHVCLQGIFTSNIAWNSTLAGNMGIF